MDKIKFKQSILGWLIKIDNSGKTEFEEGTRFVAELQAWKDLGNAIEPQFTAEEIAEKEAKESEAEKTAYIGLRKSEYPDLAVYNDALAKQHSEDETIRAAGLAQMDKYFADCLAVKEKYPKPT